MIYFILNREHLSNRMFEACEPWVFTYRGDASGEHVAMRFTEENAPEIEGGMTLEECKAAMMADPISWGCEENDFNEDSG